jgi:hypothetical protein
MSREGESTRTQGLANHLQKLEEDGEELEGGPRGGGSQAGRDQDTGEIWEQTASIIETPTPSSTPSLIPSLTPSARVTARKSSVEGCPAYLHGNCVKLLASSSRPGEWEEV